MKKPKFRSKRHNVILIQDRVSHTSKGLRGPLRCRRVTPYSHGVRPIPRDAVVINFGGAAPPFTLHDTMRVLNKPEAIAISANKLRTFEALQKANVPTVKWSVDKGEVAKWQAKDHKALARLNLNSSGGRGIKIVGPGEPIPQAPLYTRNFPKTHEFRVHVVNREAIDIVEKKIREELKDDKSNRIIRSHRNGWVFAHDNLAISDPTDLATLRRCACSATLAVGLDFGAVDILCILDDSKPRRLKSLVVCELNSAPGIENKATMSAYVKAFNTLIGTK